jgi:hypothetical protein
VLWQGSKIKQNVMLLLLSYRNPSTFRFYYSITQVVLVGFVQLLYCRGIYGTAECVPYHSALGWRHH